MPEEGGNEDFAEIPTPPTPTSKAKEEREQLEGRGIELPPNSVSIKIGSFFQVHWRAESSVPVFCFVIILAILGFQLIFALASSYKPENAWIADVMRFLSQAILTLIGAVVGSSVVSSSASRQRKPGSRP